MLAHTTDEDWTQPEEALTQSMNMFYGNRKPLWRRWDGQGSGKARQRGQLQGSLSWRTLEEGQHVVCVRARLSCYRGARRWGDRRHSKE